MQQSIQRLLGTRKEIFTYTLISMKGTVPLSTRMSIRSLPSIRPESSSKPVDQTFRSNGTALGIHVEHFIGRQSRRVLAGILDENGSANDSPTAWWFRSRKAEALKNTWVLRNCITTA
eukprot:scaffold426_cov219-Amphora_coffeaeformis.AAC.8